MAITKPAVQRPWADTGTRTPTPNDSRRSTGYVANDIPTRAELNALLNEMTMLERYVMKSGLSDWDVNETYGVGDLTRDPTTHIYYRMDVIGTNGSSPAFDPSHWVLHLPRMRATPGVFQEITAWLNANQQRRFGIDRMGFPAGKFSGWTEDWGQRNLTAQSSVGSGDLGGRWRYSLTGTGAAIAFSDPNSILRTCRHPVLTTASGATANSFLIQASPQFLNTDDYGWAWEADIKIPSGDLAHNEVTFGVSGNGLEGMTGATSKGTGGAQGLWFNVSGSSIFAFTNTAADVFTSADTGVANDTSTHRFRIEYEPVNVASDGIARAIFYIDSAVVRNFAITFAADSMTWRPFVRATLISGTASTGMNVCPGIMTWRHNTWAGGVF